MCSPCSTTSSPTLTMAVTSAGSDDLHRPGEQAGRADPAGEDGDHALVRRRRAARASVEVGVDHHRRPARRSRSCGFQPSIVWALRRVADEQVDLGRPEEASRRCTTYFSSRGRRGRTRARRTRAPSASRRWRRRSRRARPAAASATSPRRSRRRSPSRAGRRGCPRRSSVGQAELDAGHAVGDLAGHELEAAAGRLVVEQDARRRRAGRSSRGS